MNLPIRGREPIIRATTNEAVNTGIETSENVISCDVTRLRARNPGLKSTNVVKLEALNRNSRKMKSMSARMVARKSELINPEENDREGEAGMCLRETS